MFPSITTMKEVCRALAATRENTLIAGAGRPALVPWDALNLLSFVTTQQLHSQRERKKYLTLHHRELQPGEPK